MQSTDTKTPNEMLAPFRADIDALDSQIIALLEKRFDIVREVGAFKTKNGIDIVQSARVDDVLDRVSALAKAHNVPEAIIRQFYAAMIEEAHSIENDIKDSAS